MQAVPILDTSAVQSTTAVATATTATADTDHGMFSFYTEMTPLDRLLKGLQLFAVILSIIVSVRVLFFKK